MAMFTDRLRARDIALKLELFIRRGWGTKARPRCHICRINFISSRLNFKLLLMLVLGVCRATLSSSFNLVQSQLVALAERLCVGKDPPARVLHRAVQAEPHNRYARCRCGRKEVTSSALLVQLLQQFEFNVPDTIDTTVAGTTPEITREHCPQTNLRGRRTYSSSEDLASNSARSTIPQRPSRETSKSVTSSVSETLGGFSNLFRQTSESKPFADSSEELTATVSDLLDRTDEPESTDNTVLFDDGRVENDDTVTVSLGGNNVLPLESELESTGDDTDSTRRMEFNFSEAEATARFDDFPV